MDKNKMVGLLLLVLGVVSLLVQVHLLREQGRFYVAGIVSSVLIVCGIASLLSVKLSDGQFTREDGTKGNVAFKDLSTPLKVTLGLACIAAAVQFAVFKFGLPL